MALVYIGLGANLGDRALNLKAACEELLQTGKCNLIKSSTIEETKPVDYLDQPYFLNQIILIETKVAPKALLKILKRIEKKLGRKKTILKGPRIIDMDILLYDDIILNSYSLTIPHHEIKNREFVLKHLLEINPELIDPQTDIPYKNFYKKLATETKKSQALKK